MKKLFTYQKLCTEFYDLELAQRKDAASVLSFYMNYAYQARGQILEPMCGTGRFLIPMLQAGFDVEGFDASEHMLAALKQKYAQISHQQPPVWQQFVQDFSSDKRYALIFIPFGSWGLIMPCCHPGLDSGSKKCLENMYRHLMPGGKFVIEIETVASAPKLDGVWRRGERMRADGSKIILHLMTSYDIETQIFKSLCRYESVRDGVVEAIETEEFLQYLYRFDEMDQLFEQVGFTQIKKYQDYAKTSAFDCDTYTLIYECIK